MLSVVYLSLILWLKVFRDIIIESEYDPMENKKYTVRVDAEARSETRCMPTPRRHTMRERRTFKET